MANLYTAVLKRHEDGNIRDQQRRWLSTFQACTDAPCVKDYYDDRINALMDTKGGRELSTHFLPGLAMEMRGGLVSLGRSMAGWWGRTRPVQRHDVDAQSAGPTSRNFGLQSTVRAASQ